MESDEIKDKILNIPSQFKQSLINSTLLISSICFIGKFRIKYSTLRTDTKRAKPKHLTELLQANESFCTCFEVKCIESIPKLEFEKIPNVQHLSKISLSSSHPN